MKKNIYCDEVLKCTNSWVTAEESDLQTCCLHEITPEHSLVVWTHYHRRRKTLK